MSGTASTRMTVAAAAVARACGSAKGPGRGVDVDHRHGGRPPDYAARHSGGSTMTARHSQGRPRIVPSDARQKMIESAVTLLAMRGLQGTSFSDVLERSGAPRGSIYHHFPEGKDQLVDAAIELAGDRALGVLDAVEGEPPIEVPRYFLDLWRAGARAVEPAGRLRRAGGDRRDRFAGAARSRGVDLPCLARPAGRALRRTAEWTRPPRPASRRRSSPRARGRSSSAAPSGASSRSSSWSRSCSR